MKLRFISLIVGITAVFVSFLFYGWSMGTYMLVSLIGVIVALFSYVSILVGAAPKKTKLIWTVVVAITIGLELLVEPYLMQASFLYYVWDHETELNQMNALLMKHPGEVLVSKGGAATLTPDKQLSQMLEQLGCVMAAKSDQSIDYYFGSLHSPIGVRYRMSDTLADASVKHLTGRWYCF